jgi:hypothetical protein
MTLCIKSTQHGRLAITHGIVRHGMVVGIPVRVVAGSIEIL